MKRTLRCNLAATVFGLIALTAGGSSFAAATTFYGADNGVNSAGARPNADAAAASFAAALTSSTLQTFDSFALGAVPVGGLNIGGGANLTTTGFDGGGIVSGDQHSPFTLGFFVSRSQWLQYWPPTNGTSSIDIAFASPVNSFGAYFTDAQSNFPGDITISYTDGSVTETLSVTKNDNSGGALFFGFIDSSFSITSLTISGGQTNSTRDIWGLDDLRFGVAEVPEPGTYALMLAGLALLGLAARRRRV